MTQDEITTAIADMQAKHDVFQHHPGDYGGSIGVLGR